MLGLMNFPAVSQMVRTAYSNPPPAIDPWQQYLQTTSRIAEDEKIEIEEYLRKLQEKEVGLLDFAASNVESGMGAAGQQQPPSMGGLMGMAGAMPQAQPRAQVGNGYQNPYIASLMGGLV